MPFKPGRPPTPRNTLSQLPSEFRRSSHTVTRSSQAPQVPRRREPLSELESSSKRRKITGPGDEAEAYSAEDEDELSRDPYPQPQQRGLGAPGKATSRYGPRKKVISPLNGALVQEHKKVEKNMNSNSYPKGKEQSLLTGQSSNVTRNTGVNGVDVMYTRKLGIRSSPRSSKEGTTASNGYDVQTPEVSRQSSYTRHSSSPDILENSDAPREQQTSKTRHTIEDSVGPDDYIEVEHVQRNGESNNNVHRPSKDTSRSRLLSNGERKRRGLLVEQKPRSLPKQKTTRLDCAIECIAVHEATLKTEELGSSLKLASDDPHSSLHVELEGDQLLNTDFSMKNIVRAFLGSEKNSTRMRLVLSRDSAQTSGIHREHMVDIKFRSHNDFTCFQRLLVLYTNQIELVQEQDEKLEKFLRNHEIQTARRPPYTVNHESISTKLERGIAERKRKSSSLNDGDFSSKEPSRKKLISSLERDVSKLEFDPHPQAQSARRRSSRGTSGSNHLYSALGEPESPPKYSITHGLGPTWKHALEYPLSGPVSGKTRTTVEFSDLERLDEGECLNDNVVQFQLRVIQENMAFSNPRDAERVYWFNTHFFSNLTRNVKGRNEINFDAVRRWTKRIDLFRYDYIVVPVNESFHWYVIIVCNLPKLRNTGDASDQMDEAGDEASTMRSFSELQLEDTKQPEKLETRKENYEKPESFESKSNFLNESTTENAVPELPNNILAQDQYEPGNETNTVETQNDKRLEAQRAGEALGKNNTSPARRKKGPPARVYKTTQPAIISLDSLGLPHQPTIRALKTYLSREAQDKKGSMFFQDTDLQGMNAKEIPQQENFVDCGLYLLGYIEKFAQNPQTFVEKLLQRQFDVEADWPKLNPSGMRNDLRQRIFKLHEEQESLRKQRRAAASPKVPKKSEKKDDVTVSTEELEKEPEKLSVGVKARPNCENGASEHDTEDRMGPENTIANKKLEVDRETEHDEANSSALATEQLESELLSHSQLVKENELEVNNGSLTVVPDSQEAITISIEDHIEANTSPQKGGGEKGPKKAKGAKGAKGAKATEVISLD